MDPVTLRQTLLQQLENPEVEAYLLRVRNAVSKSKYNAIKIPGRKGIKIIPSLERVVDTEWDEESRYGAYALKPAQWLRAKAAAGLESFSQEEQDLAALQLMSENGSLVDVALGEIEEADAANADLFPELDKADDNSVDNSGDNSGDNSDDKETPASSRKGERMVLGAGSFSEGERARELPLDARVIGDVIAIPNSEGDRATMKAIMDLGVDEETAAKMMEVHNALPQNQENDERLIGDGLPTTFDDQFGELIDQA